MTTTTASSSTSSTRVAGHRDASRAAVDRSAPAEDLAPHGDRGVRVVGEHAVDAELEEQFELGVLLAAGALELRARRIAFTVIRDQEVVLRAERVRVHL